MRLRLRLRLVGIVLALAACKSHDTVDSCQVLFGNPTADTGLTPSQCRPACACNGVSFTPPNYDAAFMQALVDDWQPVTPFPPLTIDPYTQPVPPDDPAGTVCAVIAPPSNQKPRPYELMTFASSAGATAASAHVTHYGHCGVCSTLANLAVYMRNNDLGKAVRACAFANGAPDGGDPDLQCLLGLGFDMPCAQIWAYNTANTRRLCLQTCVANFDAPYNNPDGTLNPCLQCDEDLSGPVFKAVAGRTRRNSGLPNAICRPCSQVQPLTHAY
jgi:hypothetical protein